ncbi:MAG: hypothetical protein INQ03_19905 [Candidatus Heimdallarchaeota archaeon]|nr:hypothetical protein [Candidatus Heimdallarchaeota archaeon]
MFQVNEWILEGDPAIQYIAHRDLLDASKSDIDLFQMYMEINDGWVKTLLEKQDDAGTWMQSLHTPKWTATLWVLTFLRRLGISNSVIGFKKGIEIIVNSLEEYQQWDGGIDYEHNKKSDVQTSALILALMSYAKLYQPRKQAIFEFLIESQLDDGGWSSDYYREKAYIRSSPLVTLLVLEAIDIFVRYEKKYLSTVDDMRSRAHEYLIENSLYRISKSTLFKDHQTEFSFPSWVSYSILDALDYFQSINYKFDPRLEEAVQLIRLKKDEDRWKNESSIMGENWIDFSDDDRDRIITIKATRIIRWWTKISKFRESELKYYTKKSTTAYGDDLAILRKEPEEELEPQEQTIVEPELLEKPIEPEILTAAQHPSEVPNVTEQSISIKTIPYLKPPNVGTFDEIGGNEVSSLASMQVKPVNNYIIQSPNLPSEVIPNVEDTSESIDKSLSRSVDDTQSKQQKSTEKLPPKKKPLKPLLESLEDTSKPTIVIKPTTPVKNIKIKSEIADDDDEYTLFLNKGKKPRMKKSRNSEKSDERKYDEFIDLE